MKENEMLYFNEYGFLSSLISNKPHKISTIKVHVRPIVGWIASFLVFSYTISFFIIIP